LKFKDTYTISFENEIQAKNALNVL